MGNSYKFLIMESFRNILVLLMITCFCLIILALINISEREELEERVIVLEEQVMQKDSLDILYWKHLEQCAFELREGIDVDINN